MDGVVDPALRRDSMGKLWRSAVLHQGIETA